MGVEGVVGDYSAFLERHGEANNKFSCQCYISFTMVRTSGENTGLGHLFFWLSFEHKIERLFHIERVDQSIAVYICLPF